MSAFTVTLRRASSVSLAVSFAAMAISGSLMLAFEDQAVFQLRMHPVHNIFGLVMVFSGLVHVALSWGAMAKHLQHRWAAALGVVLSAVAALLLVMGLAHPMDSGAVARLEEAYRSVHGADRHR